MKIVKIDYIDGVFDSVEDCADKIGRSVVAVKRYMKATNKTLPPLVRSVKEVNGKIVVTWMPGFYDSMERCTRTTGVSRSTLFRWDKWVEQRPRYVRYFGLEEAEEIELDDADWAQFEV